MRLQRAGLVFGFLGGMLVASSVAHAADAPGSAPALAGAMVSDELEKLNLLRRLGGSTKKDLGDLCDLPSKEFSELLAKAKEKPEAKKTEKSESFPDACKSVKVDDFKKIVEELETRGDSKTLTLLAAALRRQQLREESPALSPEKLNERLLKDSVVAFTAEKDAPLWLADGLGDKVLKMLQKADEEAKVPPRKQLTGAGLKEFLEKKKLEGFSDDEILKIAAGAEFSAALQLEDYMGSKASQMVADLERRVPEGKFFPRTGQQGRQGPGAGAGGGEPGAQQPGGGGGTCSPGGGGQASNGGGHGAGGQGSVGGAGGPEMVNRVRDIFEDGKPAVAASAEQQGRKSISMKIGQVGTDQVTGDRFFVGNALCQATVVKASENEPRFVVVQNDDPAKSVCRFVIPTADHCFRHLQDSDYIRLDGFEEPIDAGHRQVVRNGGDFATLLVDAPCNTQVPEEVLAPPGAVQSNKSQLIVLDVQQTGRKSVAGKSVGSDQSGTLDFSIAGNGQIYPGDSGGRFSLVGQDGASYFAGVLSMKKTDAAYRDAGGRVATVPDSFYQSLGNGSYFQPLQRNLGLTHDTSRQNRTRVVAGHI